MRIAITGASGFVGRAIVAELTKLDVATDMLLVGRDRARLETAFPGRQICTYDELEDKAVGFDILLHLSTLNNNVEGAFENFYAVNVQLALDSACSAKAAGIPLFIYASSIHALDEQRTDHYSESKRVAAKELGRLTGIRVVTIYLGAVHANRWSGKLSILNGLPEFLSGRLFKMLAALRPTTSVRRIVQEIRALPGGPVSGVLIVTDGQEENHWYKIVSRTIDVLGALAVAIGLWWLFIVLWFAIKLESPGPGIFAQERVGRYGRTFTCYKFRTMHVGTVQAATNLVPANAVTAIGRVLRITKLDELPQVWNILKNEMSFIGPRPCLPAQHELVRAREILGVLEIKPGISGLAQVHGVDMSNPQRLAELDARYLALRSLSLDFKIILATLKGSGRGDNTAA